MNSNLFNLSHLPERDKKPRNGGMTMVMDKGLSLREVEDFLSMSSGAKQTRDKRKNIKEKKRNKSNKK